GSLMLALTTAIMGLIGATAMAGAGGGGGMGERALGYGDQRLEKGGMMSSVGVLVRSVEWSQAMGNASEKKEGGHEREERGRKRRRRGRG
ncbi:hypothetical protein DV965_15650, partial [Staphylococcus pseudintermedius]